MHQNWANFDTSLKVCLLQALRLQFWIPITTELLPKKARGAQNDAWPLCSPLPRTSNLHLPRLKSPRDNGAALFFRPARPNLIFPASPPHTRILRASPPQWLQLLRRARARQALSLAYHAIGIPF